jgi:hypothetical protein
MKDKIEKLEARLKKETETRERLKNRVRLCDATIKVIQDKIDLLKYLDTI